VDWLKAQKELVKLRFDEKEWQIIVNFTALMIEAAEQSGLAEHIENAGEVKKAFVMAQVQAFLDDNGIEMDIDRIADLVEGLVYGSLTQFKEIEK
jgi:hypothetical protein